MQVKQFGDKVREARTGLDLYREEMVDIFDKEC